MNRSSLRPFLFSLVLAAAWPLAASAQVQTKAPPRLPPSATEAARIPAGVDTGSPATSDALPLGTPVPPNASAGRTELTAKSAAARAAARPKPTASSVACTKKAPVQADASTPKASLVGNPAKPSTAAASASSVRLDC